MMVIRLLYHFVMAIWVIGVMFAGDVMMTLATMATMATMAMMILMMMMIPGGGWGAVLGPVVQDL